MGLQITNISNRIGIKKEKARNISSLVSILYEYIILLSQINFQKLTSGIVFQSANRLFFNLANAFTS